MHFAASAVSQSGCAGSLTGEQGRLHISVHALPTSKLVILQLCLLALISEVAGGNGGKSLYYQSISHHSMSSWLPKIRLEYLSRGFC